MSSQAVFQEYIIGYTYIVMLLDFKEAKLRDNISTLSIDQYLHKMNAKVVMRCGCGQTRRYE